MVRWDWVCGCAFVLALKLWRLFTLSVCWMAAAIQWPRPNISRFKFTRRNAKRQCKDAFVADSTFISFFDNCAMSPIMEILHRLVYMISFDNGIFPRKNLALWVQYSWIVVWSPPLKGISQRKLIDSDSLANFGSKIAVKLLSIDCVCTATIATASLFVQQMSPPSLRRPCSRCQNRITIIHFVQFEVRRIFAKTTAGAN